MNKLSENIYNRLMHWIAKLTAVWKDNHNFKNNNSRHLTENEFMDLAQAVKDLSGGLKGDRDFIGKKYLQESNLLGAYLLYFWPVSYAQTRIILDAHNIKGESALDIGCGPGPNTMAMIDHGIKRVLSCDRVRSATLVLKKLAVDIKGAVILKEWDALQNAQMPGGRYDLIFIGHLLNEMWKNNEKRIDLRKSFILSLSGLLKSGGSICILEPALTKTSRELIQLRNMLVSEGLYISGPCHANEKCGLIGGADNATCHSEYGWKQPHILRKISSFAGNKKDILKFSYLVLRKEKIEGGKDSYLVVSDPLLSKSGRLRYFICGSNGRISLSCDDNIKYFFKDVFLKLKRGNIIKITKADITENGMSLNRESKVILIK